MSAEALQQLRQNVEQLRGVLLPVAANKADDGAAKVSEDVPEPLPDGEVLRIRAFLVLAHAAIEELLENELYESVRDSVSARGVAPPAVALALATKYAVDVMGQNGGKVPAAGSIADKLPGLYYTKVIYQNNGIRRKSIDGMCKPLGLDPGSLGESAEAALAHLDTLGAKRGSAAHTFLGAATEVVTAEQAGGWVDDALGAMETLVPLLQAAVIRRELMSEGRDE